MIYAVTGANGHLGRTLCEQLTASGCGVRAVVRPGRADQLKTGSYSDYCFADLSSVSDLESAFQGVHGVFHTAAPTRMWAPDPDADIARPIAEGTLNVIRAASQAGVRKIVHTSTAAAVSLHSESPCNEDNWNLQSRHPQFRAKIRAEIEGSQLARNLGISFVSVCPPSVIGPGFVSDTPGTEPYRMLLQEKLPFLPPGTFHLLDVRDHAKSQQLIMERACLNYERYIIAGHRFELKSIIALLSTLYPEMKLPKHTLPRFVFKALSFAERLLYTLGIVSGLRMDKKTLDECVGCEQRLDGSRFHKEFEFQFTDPGETLRDMMDYLALTEQGSL